MSLYVSIILLSALSVFDEGHPPAEGQVFLLEAGTTLGLVLAHGFASWVSTRIIGDTEEEVRRPTCSSFRSAEPLSSRCWP